MAASTSRAAASMLRFRSNCMVTFVCPMVLDEVISVTEAIRLNWRASGVATADAMVSGLAPGRLAPTEIVGYSTWGRGATGSMRKATPPARATATVRSVVAIGLRMKGSEMLIRLCRVNWPEAGPRHGSRRVRARIAAPGGQTRDTLRASYKA